MHAPHNPFKPSHAALLATLLFAACDRPADPPAAAEVDPDVAAPAAAVSGSASEVALNPQMARMDVNEDGTLSFDEHALGAASRFTRMDTDGDDHLTEPELLAGAASAGEADADVRLAAADENRDGRLSRDEHERGARTSFEQMDADSDGQLTWRELENQAQVAVNQR